MIAASMATQIVVKTLEGKTIMLDVESDDSTSKSFMKKNVCHWVSESNFTQSIIFFQPAGCSCLETSSSLSLFDVTVTFSLII
jgi:hypothetical protein